MPASHLTPAALVHLPDAPPGGCITTSLWALAIALAGISLGPALAAAPRWLAPAIPAAALLAALAAAWLTWLNARPRLDRRAALATLAGAPHAPGRSSDADLASALLRACRCHEADCSRLTRDHLDDLESRLGRSLPRIWVHNAEPVLASLARALSDDPPAPDPAPSSITARAHPHDGPVARFLTSLLVAITLGGIVALAIASAAAVGRLAPFTARYLTGFSLAALITTAAYIATRLTGHRGWSLHADPAGARLLRRDRRGRQLAEHPLDPADTLIIITASTEAPAADPDDPAAPPPLQWWVLPPRGLPACSIAAPDPRATPWRDALRRALPAPPPAPRAPLPQEPGPRSAR